MMAQKYGIGKQDFASMRERGFVYVDKTQFIIELLEGADYYFLCRPRRFGKSLFLSTLEQFFLGKRELFNGLAIDSYDWNWEAYPVVKISFTSGSFSEPDGLRERMIEILEENEERYSISPKGANPRARLRNLLIELNRKTGKEVVILVDEYEKPLLDAIDNKHFDSYKYELRDFYSVIKNNEDIIRFLFITGVTRFGHLNIFSGLNNLNDISLDDRYASICGITHDELTEYFSPGISDLAVKEGIDFEQALTELKDFYDGYHFSGDLIDVYNPFSLIQCLYSTRFTYKWFSTGSSSFLIDKLRKSHTDISTLEGINVSEDTLSGVDASFFDMVTLLYQSGYLTIKAYNRREKRYTLGLPNYEVKSALYSAIIPYYLGSNYRMDNGKALDFLRFLESGEAHKAMEWLKGFFKGIPYDVKLDYERDFQTVIYSFFALVGLHSQTTLEKQTSDGRIDMVLELKDYVYVFEFKLGDDAGKALSQINSKEYDLPWSATGRKKVFKIGIAFSPEKRGISDFIIED